MKATSYGTYLEWLPAGVRGRALRDHGPFVSVPNWLPIAGPLLGGVIAAMVILWCLQSLPAAQQVSGMAALVGTCSWLYLGQALRGYSAGQVTLDLLTALLLWSLASYARSSPVTILSAAFAVQVLWALMQLSRKADAEQDHPQLLLAWASCHTILALSGWIIFA